MTEKLRVLIVDDDPGVLRLAATVLSQAGYAVHACASGEEASKYLVDHEVELLLTDKDLGRMSGVDVARAARAQRPDLPIVLMTGAPDRHSVGAFSFQGYLVKPFRNNKAIHDAVAAALEAHQAAQARKALSRRLEELTTQLTPVKKGP